MKVLAAEIDFGDGMEYVATVAFATLGTDTPANTLFRARLTDAAFERSVSFAVHRGDRSVVPAIQELVFRNADGALDGWLDREIKDRQVVLKTGYIDQAYSTWTVRARLTGDKVSQAGRTGLVLKFKSKLQRLEKQATAAWSTSVPNVEIRGSRKPVAIGKLNYAGGVLYQHYSNYERFYAISDWPIYSITQWWSRYTLGVNPGYFVQGVPEAIYGLRRRTTASNPGPDDRMCLEMRGAGRLGTEMLGSTGTFTSWTGDDPNGWTVTEVAGTVTQSPTGSARISGEDVWISWTGLTVGVLYQIEILTTAIDSGVWMLMNGEVEIHYEPFDANFGEPRVWRLSFIALDASIAIGVPSGATGTLSIDRVRVWPISAVDRIKSWVEHLCIDRGGLVSADVDSTSLTALEAAKPFDLAYANPQGIEIDDLLWMALDSLNASVFEGIDGKLRAAWLRDPADMTPVGTITDDDLVESWEWEDDEMDGLSTSLICAVNYAQFSESEIQSLQSVLTITPEIVEALRRADRRVVSTVTPASHYSRAADQSAIPSLLVASTAAQTEVEARCTLASERRRFGRAALRDRAAFAPMEPGQAWTVSSARFGEFKAYVMLVRGTLLGTEPVLRIRVWR